MREEPVPATVAPEPCQIQQGFISRRTPELARALEPALGLPTGGFHRSAANRLARAPSGPINPFVLDVRRSNGLLWPRPAPPAPPVAIVLRHITAVRSDVRSG